MIDTKSDLEKKINENKEEEKEKISMVFRSDTVVNPRTMMIID